MEHKIIFSGPVGAGKTTAIKTISDIPVVDTESRASDQVALCKETTTVAMDYGAISLPGGDKLHLYGTPGQERFSFMWEITASGGLGLVLLIDNTSNDPLADLAFYMSAFPEFAQKKQVVFGITHTDVSASPSLDPYRERLLQMNMVVPVFEVDPRKYSDVSVLLQALLAILDPGIAR
ncbi:GTP-binding protein [Microbulbifer rhizosphaerae]|uniref:GTP-binding protein n=1 Tax=Microbulbifer rhizosphaerae TaxID=1562603 RepID=A0A7W4ZA59_9GAMM|nr:ATP/GTP-binding protein [Microbulbifer rhizosphaerae]MBB3062412.1 hypothetical protein [Microbulbifer rhizosphaerae]